MFSYLSCKQNDPDVILLSVHSTPESDLNVNASLQWIMQKKVHDGTNNVSQKKIKIIFNNCTGKTFDDTILYHLRYSCNEGTKLFSYQEYISVRHSPLYHICK